MRHFYIIAIGAVLGGCAGASYVINEYQGVEIVQVPMPEDTYRVYDKPAQNKMMITPSLGASALQGAGQGLLFNAVDNTPPKPMFEAVALKHLETTGRIGCKITDAYMVLKPQYEVKYDCAPAATQQTPLAHSSSKPKRL